MEKLRRWWTLARCMALGCEFVLELATRSVCRHCGRAIGV